MMSQLLALGLGKIKQPKVIAEVLGGILLGPFVLLSQQSPPLIHRRSYCLWTDSRFYKPHLSLPIPLLPLISCQYWPLPLSLHNRSRDRCIRYQT